jgi:hypothetical protein
MLFIQCHVGQMISKPSCQELKKSKIKIYLILLIKFADLTYTCVPPNCDQFSIRNHKRCKKNKIIPDTDHSVDTSESISEATANRVRKHLYLHGRAWYSPLLYIVSDLLGKARSNIKKAPEFSLPLLINSIISIYSLCIEKYHMVLQEMPGEPTP